MSAKAQHPLLRRAHGRGLALLVGASIAVLAVLGVVVWLVLTGGDDKTPRAAAHGLSLRQLKDFASNVGHPVYWAGSQPRFTYELSRTRDGRVYIRYLPPGVKPGDKRAGYLTVATYPQRNAFATIRATAHKQGLRALDVSRGGVAFQYKNRPTSVYLAYPGSNFQIEVFAPSPAVAVHVASSGQVKPVGTSPSTRAKSQVASPRQLKQIAITIGHPIYWAGSRSNMTYELTRTTDGSVYVRYLPRGVAVGRAKPGYLTVGTYPLKHALAILKRTAARNHAPTTKLAGGGLAFTDRRHPTSVYVAYPKLDLQIEVYSPKPGRPQQLVGSGQIGPIR